MKGVIPNEPPNNKYQWSDIWVVNNMDIVVSGIIFTFDVDKM